MCGWSGVEWARVSRRNENENKTKHKPSCPSDVEWPRSPRSTISLSSSMESSRAITIREQNVRFTAHCEVSADTPSRRANHRRGVEIAAPRHNNNVAMGRRGCQKVVSRKGGRGVDGGRGGDGQSGQRGRVRALESARLRQIKQLDEVWCRMLTHVASRHCGAPVPVGLLAALWSGRENKKK